MITTGAWLPHNSIGEGRGRGEIVQTNVSSRSSLSLPRLLQRFARANPIWRGRGRGLKPQNVQSCIVIVIGIGISRERSGNRARARETSDRRRRRARKGEKERERERKGFTRAQQLLPGPPDVVPDISHKDIPIANTRPAEYLRRPRPDNRRLTT